MSKVLNFGSVNIDHVYRVEHFVRPGETLHSSDYRRFAGGKGFNQSVALARAGAEVFHAGRIGADGLWLQERLRQERVDTSFLRVGGGPTGHAIIQVNRDGENAIVLFGGANQEVVAGDAEEVIPRFAAGDYLLLQNEISNLPSILRLAAKRGMRIVFNPAPMHADVLDYPLDGVAVFVVNEVEGAQFAETSEPEAILRRMRSRFPSAAVVLTLGREGAMYADASVSLRVPATGAKAVDSTAAGDTFIGFYLAELMRSGDTEAALKLGCEAAGICVTRPGAADSIPTRAEVEGA
jgi:ribokinase